MDRPRFVLADVTLLPYLGLLIDARVNRVECRLPGLVCHPERLRDRLEPLALAIWGVPNRAYLLHRRFDAMDAWMSDRFGNSLEKRL